MSATPAPSATARPGPATTEISFELSDTERMVRDTARAALASFGDNQALVALELTELGYDPAVWARIVELGWPGFAVLEAHGGGGGSMIEVGLLIEEIGYAAYPSPLLQATTAAIVLGALAPAAAEPGRSLAAGEIAVLAAPLSGAATRADRHGERFVLSGPPIVLEWAHAAAWLIVLARAGASGWALLGVPAADLAGRVRVARSLDNERLGVVDLGGLEATALATTTDGDEVAEALARVRLVRAAEMAGGATRTLELTRDYMLERHQFGVPLGSFQAVQHHLADMQIDVDAALLTAREGLSLASLGQPARAAAAIAGFVAGRSYTRTTITAAQLFAGVGAAKEHRLHHHFRRAKAMQLRLGTAAAQRQLITETVVRGQPPGPWRN